MATRAQINGNPVARSPLLRKGGAHQRERSGERQQSQQQLDSLLDEWYEDQQNNGETSSFAKPNRTELK